LDVLDATIAEGRSMNVETFRASNTFARFAFLVALGKGNIMAAIAAGEELPGSGAAVAILKSAVAAGTTSDPTWAGALADYVSAQRAFFDAAESGAVFDRLRADGAMLSAPLHAQLVVNATAVSGDVPGEGQPGAFSALNFSGPPLEPQKALAFVGVGDTLLRAAGSAGQAMLARALRAGVTAATDKRFLAAIITGASTVTGSSSVLADLGAGLAVVNTTGAGRPYLVVDPSTANRLATKATPAGEQVFPDMAPLGGTLAGVPVLVSDQAPAEDSSGAKAVLLDATAIVGNAEIVTLDASQSAAVQLSNSPAAGAAGLTSAFQTNTTFLKARRWFGYRLIRSTGVALLEGLSW
jgi:hypothetical protein